jgi:hypothetical protein
MPQPKLTRILVDGLPVKTVTPALAECLRWDLGFVANPDISLCVFPMFAHRKYGSTGTAITVSRWAARGFTLAPITVDWDGLALDVMSFTTFRQGNGLLIPTTLDNFLLDQDYMYRVAGFRQLEQSLWELPPAPEAVSANF